MDERTPRQKRQETAYQFTLQAGKLFFSIVKAFPNYRYIVKDESRGKELTALVLFSSWDYYEYRINRGKKRVDLLIVQHHNAVVPLPLICLESGKEYRPGVEPEATRPNAKRPNTDEVRVLVSKLILGVDGIDEQLQKMPPRTRQRYLQRCSTYKQPRIGRPWAS
jgi:hypothetical protein